MMGKHRVTRSDAGDSIAAIQGVGDMPGERVWTPGNRRYNQDAAFMDTPWGRADNYEDIGQGIMSVSTPSHGGYFVPPSVLRIMPKGLVNRDGWYEEDCEWCKVAVAFPHLFPKDTFGAAERMLVDRFPAAAAAIGYDVTCDNSSVLRERAFIKEHRDDYVVVSAWGDWAPGVPSGQVLCQAVRGGRKENGQYASDDKAFFLVGGDEYAKRSSFGFVVDEQRHRQVEAPDLSTSILAAPRVTTPGTLKL